MMKRLMEDLKISMKEKDKYRKEAIQGIIGKAKYLAKEKLVEVEDSHILQAVQIELKQISEAFEMMESHMTDEKKTEYLKKIETIKSYLPKQLSEMEINTEIENTFNELALKKEMKSMGVLMKTLSGKLTGKVDNSILSKLIKEFLNK